MSKTAQPLIVTIHLDGTGVHYDPHEPMHLDDIIHWAVMPFQRTKAAPARDEKPDDIKLPLGRWEIGNQWGWSASALFPDGDTFESLMYWRKRFQQNRADLTTGTPVLTNSTYREYNTPVPVLLCHKLVGFAWGNASRIRRLLRKQLRAVGKKRDIGLGRVCGIEVEPYPDDFTCVRDGKAMRYLPDPDGIRLCRPRPPYWNQTGRVNCCDVGDAHSGY